MENHRTRPEIVSAFRTGYGQAVRYSNTLQRNMMYVAVLSQREGRVLGVVRTAIPLTFVDEELSSTKLRIALSGVVIAILAAVVILFVSRRISRPLEELRAGAERFASGDLRTRLRVDGSEEISTLAEAMNRMAAQLDHRINLISQQSKEQEAILTSMTEGVLAVDTDERVINFNRAAAEMLDFHPQHARGMTVQEAVRNTHLQEIIGHTLRSRESHHGEVIFPGLSERVVQVSATILRDTEGNDIGALMVLNDITRIRRLENLKKEFVANVSHELKTPITSIIGSVETLLGGAMEEKSDANRFLKIVSRQADRLYRIVEDLLSLSRLERDTDESAVPLEMNSIRPVLDAAVQVCESKAKEKSIRVEVECDPNLRAEINAPLLEQAIVNLLDNAVTYSDMGQAVEISAGEENDKLVISVKDQGCGIEQKYLPRIFERFYRVDKARSRESGGTGLGLSIVKHIALVHGGEVKVESKIDVGSTFTIILPASSVKQEPESPPV
jgi:two-component system phosphate regulon sensor histidine kinase PhoR